MDTVTHKAARLADKRSASFASALLGGMFTSVVLLASFLFLASFLLLRTADPLRFLWPAAWIGSLLTALLGGFRAARLHRKSGALTGLALGLILSFLFLLSALVVQKGSLPALSIPLYLGILLSSTIGGTLATRKKAYRRVRRRK